MMDVFWIVGGVALYLIVGGFLTGLLGKLILKQDGETAGCLTAAIVLGWPICSAIVLGGFVATKLNIEPEETQREE